MNQNSFDKFPEALQAALARLNVLVGEETLDYFYELYDSETGGFYYSISSRDSKEMTPFAEGTCFVQEALLAGGMTLPDWYKEKVGKWIQSHQDESDGFFYEELWGKITSGPRLNRDLAYSKSILSRCGYKQLYALPEDRIKSEGIASNATLPEYLQSEEKMTEYLDSLDWSQKSIWSTGQKLSTAGSLIKAAGLYDLTRNYIKAKQNLNTGLFGEGLGWMNTNGAMKLSAFFTSTEHPYPNSELAIESVKRLYTGDTPPTSATFIWNPFVLLKRILDYAGENTDKLRALLYESGADIVNRAIDCALLLKRDDGGFAGNLTRGSKLQQGYLYGHGLRWESDLDGTLIAGQRLYSAIYSVFGLTAPSNYYLSRNDEFWERCKNKPETVKSLPRPEGALSPSGAMEPVR
ncbi:MAG: hypothetical protein E7612_10580 [Ruminococcaceae bacterium]|nr:hypothetical protein [Oscillospiraceae bacterium]